MAETSWTLDTPDGFKIYGVLQTPAKKKNTKAILHIHGLGANAYNYASTRMAQTFIKHGYDVIRPNLYSWKKGARSLIDCTIAVHAQDIQTIVKHFKKKYKKLYATGHSYGGPSLMTADINQFDAVSLWDPSYIPQKSISKDDFIKAGNLRIWRTGLNNAVSKEFVDESQLFDREHARKLSKKCKIPLQVIYGDKESFWIGEGESFHTYAKGPTDERVIKTSQHSFYEEGSTETLLRYTKKWFDQF